MEFNCSCCKKKMQPLFKKCNDGKNEFYKTCESCRKKQRDRYVKSRNTKLLQNTQMTHENPIVQPVQISDEKNECYICYNEFSNTLKGASCLQCKKTCCSTCYMKIFIKSRDNVKCGLCRYQSNFSTIVHTQRTFALLTLAKAILCGYDTAKSIEWAQYSYNC